EHQYHYVSERKNWTEAQSYCREKYKDLVTIERMEDVNILNNILSSYSHPSWIGLHVEKWTWSLADEMFYSDGEAEFRNWYNGEPNNFAQNEYCTAMWYSEKWNDYPCESTIPSVCSDVRGENFYYRLRINISSHSFFSRLYSVMRSCSCFLI
uniref:C-type lectin domain-containing protein n=1 Tax=Amphiprion ocellaris TaxID=80972 RepID=A0AAQ5Y5D1_AMPOC